MPYTEGKTSIFATFGGHLGSLWKMKKCEYLEKRERQSYFVQMFDPQGSLTYFLHLNSYLLTFLVNTISRAQLLRPFLLSLLL